MICRKTKSKKDFNLFQIAQSYCFAGEARTTAELLKSEFCKEYACLQTSKFTNCEGEDMISFLVKKEAANLDLLATVKGGKIKNLTLKSGTLDTEVDKNILWSFRITSSDSRAYLWSFNNFRVTGS